MAGTRVKENVSDRLVHNLESNEALCAYACESLLCCFSRMEQGRRGGTLYGKVGPQIAEIRLPRGYGAREGLRRRDARIEMHEVPSTHGVVDLPTKIDIEEDTIAELN